MQYMETPYIILGHVQYTVGYVTIRSNVVLLLPCMIGGYLFYESINTLHDNELNPEHEHNNKLEPEMIVKYLVNAIENYWGVDLRNPMSIEHRNTLITPAVTFLDNYIKENSKVLLLNREYKEYIEFLKDINARLCDFKLPNTIECLNEICEREADNRYVSAKVKFIQAAWRHAYYDPSHLVCKKRLMSEFLKLKEEIGFI